MTTHEEMIAAPVGSTIKQRSTSSVFTKQGNNRWQSSDSLYDYPTNAFNAAIYELTLTQPLDKDQILADYKQEVRAKAEALAKQHGWCEVVEKALEDLGIPKPVKVWKVGDKVERKDLRSLPIGTVTHSPNKGYRLHGKDGKYVQLRDSSGECVAGVQTGPGFPVSTIVFLPGDERGLTEEI